MLRAEARRAIRQLRVALVITTTVAIVSSIMAVRAWTIMDERISNAYDYAWQSCIEENNLYDRYE